MKVFVYFNLHKKIWSVKALEGENKGRVIMHCTSVELEDCTLKVSQAGRERVIREKQKNVHAGVVGRIVAYNAPCESTDIQVTYNPYKYNSFVEKETEVPVITASKAYMCAQTGMTRVFISK